MKDDKYLLPSATPTTPTPTEVTVINADPLDLYMMIQAVIRERPLWQTFLDQGVTPQDIIFFIGWMVGLMHNQHPALYKAQMEAIEIGKDVALVLREQAAKEGMKFPVNGLVTIWPTSLMLGQFQNDVSDKVQ